MAQAERNRLGVRGLIEASPKSNSQRCSGKGVQEVSSNPHIPMALPARRIAHALKGIAIAKAK